ncbi:MAG: PadR family transcriptional regulator [Anaerolineales bacterium]
MPVRHAILGFLAQQPRHGYELRAAFDALLMDDTWEVKPAQVYSTLDRLAESGLIVCQSDLGEGEEPSRRIYALAPAGQQALQDWFNAPVAAQHQRDELFIKLMVALISGEGQPERIVSLQRSAIYQEMHKFTRLRDACNPRGEMAQILLFEKAIMHLEADLRWLEMAEIRLETIKKQPLPEPEIRPRGRPKKQTD